MINLPRERREEMMSNTNIPVAVCRFKDAAKICKVPEAGRSGRTCVDLNNLAEHFQGPERQHQQSTLEYLSPIIHSHPAVGVKSELKNERSDQSPPVKTQSVDRKRQLPKPHS